MHLALFVPWADFQSMPADDVEGTWKSFAVALKPRIQSCVRNIALLRASAEDARADRKLQGRAGGIEEPVDNDGFFGEERGDDGFAADSAIGPDDCYHTILNIVGKIGQSGTKNLPATSDVRQLYEELRSRGAIQIEPTATRRGAEFYRTLQDQQESPLRGVGLLGREEIDAVYTLQKKMDKRIVANIEGQGTDEFAAGTDGRQFRLDAGLPTPPSTQKAPRPGVGMGPGGQVRLEVGPSSAYIDVALQVSEAWTLNKEQMKALLLPALFLDERRARSDDEGAQHLQYVGGEGGTGKSRVIEAMKDLFRLKDGLDTMLLTGANGNAAALIGGVTIHSAVGFGFGGIKGGARLLSEERKLQWKKKIVVVIDEISQVGGELFLEVDNRLRAYRDDRSRPFGGIPIVLLMGDFFQFEPVRDTSLLLPRRKHSRGDKVEADAKQLQAHKLFLQFNVVVILREQVRAGRCPRLRGFLQRLRRGEQTELDFQRLCNLYNRQTQPTFTDGLRAITPLNQDRWSLNTAAVVQWARGQGKHISIFVGKHDVEGPGELGAQQLYDLLSYGDDSLLATPGVFFYAQGMPVVLTKNQLTGLKLVNGAPFRAVEVFPDPSFPGIALAGDVTLHLGPPAAMLIESEATAETAVPGLPKGMMLVKPEAVRVPSELRGGRWRAGKPGFARVTHRTGLPCTPSFAVTDQKSQGKQFSDVLVNLKGGRGRNALGKPTFMSLYVQLSRAETWDGLYLSRPPERADFIEPKNVLDPLLRLGVRKLEEEGIRTSERFEREQHHRCWFQGWDAMPEPMSPAEENEAEDQSVWGEIGRGPT